MSSAYPNYGDLKVKNVKIDQSGIVFHDNADDSKTATLKVASLGAGNVDISLPTSAGALLNAASSLDAAKLTGIQALGQPGIADADVLLYADASDSNNPKGIAASDLKTYCASAGLPTGNTPANALIADGAGDFQSVALSGDVTVNASGVTAIGNSKVTNAMLAGSIAYGKLDLNNAIQNADLAGSIATSKLADAPGSAGTVQASKIVQVDASKDISGFNNIAAEGYAQVGAAQAFYIGDASSDGSYRMRINGGNFVVEKREIGSWVQKGEFTA